MKDPENKRSCQNCTFFLPADVEKTVSIDKIWGNCHRHAPSVASEKGACSNYAYWPLVHGNEFCGEYSSEVKID